jgi:two-component system sensor histidine kinase YesM
MDDPRGFMNYGSGAAKKTIVYYKVPNVNWTLMAVIPFEQYQAQNRYVLSITALAVGLAMLIIAAFVLFFVQRVTKPLQSLAHSLKDFQPDDDVVAIRVTSSDEVGLLIHSYNKLGERIQRLMNQVQRNEALKKEADMQALQAQINPHFLYNTLASIHWMALMNQDPKIAEMVGSLSDFLRFSLNRGHEYCHVKQEMEHARHYASIQNIRYPNQFEIEFIIDAAIESKWMLKLLLQPLIENAIIHGIMQQQDNGYISVRAQPLNEGWMHFTVEDSGKGLTTEQLQLIRQRLEAPMDQHAGPQGSYGLRNVHQRLQLHYGQDTGLTIESIAGHGTQVSFSIPYKEDLI